MSEMRDILTLSQVPITNYSTSQNPPFGTQMEMCTSNIKLECYIWKSQSKWFEAFFLRVLLGWAGASIVPPQAWPELHMEKPEAIKNVDLIQVTTCSCADVSQASAVSANVWPSPEAPQIMGEVEDQKN